MLSVAARLARHRRPYSSPRRVPGGRVDAALFLPLITLVAAGVLVFLLWPRDLGERPPLPEESKPVSADLPVVVLETTQGTIKAQMFTDKAPNTAQNFIDLVEQGYYDGIIFHRVIPNFMIQGGDPTGTGRGGRTAKGLPPKKLADEFHPDLRHDSAGIFSMANAGPNTGDTQFFITCCPTPHLDNKHAVFGKVIEGMDVVHKIENVPTGSADRPVEEQKIITAKVEKPAAK